MKSDQTLPGRRSVLRIAACLGAAATTGTLFTELGRSPDKGAAPGPAAGAQAAAAGPPVRESAYRLQPMTADVPPRFRRALPPVRTRPFERFRAPGRSLVLTFDDGPDPHYTPGILSTLRQYHVSAMFFVCGQMVADNPELLREIARDGHIVGNHTWSHPLIPGLPPSKIRSELSRTSEVIKQTLGAAPLWYRAPYGAWNKLSFEIGAELGMEPLGWTLDSRDWTEPGTATIVRRVLDSAAPGVVILSHDAGGNRAQSVAALRRYLPELLDAGYSITVPHR
ncbi:polysaccharide deacetylase family protein [Streptomyces sp. NPDC029004]|uniref:polysaccharide deacetylase family protein n=1 Tax=Streptomyces sp. NPDC029004 TaxID=3154490 RepID=UPI00340A3254